MDQKVYVVQKSKGLMAQDPNTQWVVVEQIRYDSGHPRTGEEISYHATKTAAQIAADIANAGTD